MGVSGYSDYEGCVFGGQFRPQARFRASTRINFFGRIVPAPTRLITARRDGRGEAREGGVYKGGRIPGVGPYYALYGQLGVGGTRSRDHYRYGRGRCGSTGGATFCS